MTTSEPPAPKCNTSWCALNGLTHRGTWEDRSSHFTEYENALWDADPHAYTDEQCDLLFNEQADEAEWPEGAMKFLVLQWFGAFAALEAIPVEE